MTTQAPTLALLQKFVDSRPGLNFADYGDVRAYRNESAEITRDRSDFYELLRLALNTLEGFSPNKQRNLLGLEPINNPYFDEPWTTPDLREQRLDEKIKNYLTTTSGRLTLENNKLQYITGQYFPTEYRPAACRVLVSIIWNAFSKILTDSKGDNVTGHDIRQAIKKHTSRRVGRLYFN